ncbi:MAG: uncharacterized protein KVP18_001823 [Porospora cf. gigantea A]|uniref:uncharacterized protein n=1 Tax=Porospora cf. gigantea A TaxID=2853593 RepID=UPI00355AB03C|nr:MAG: hypothetical protein KVP18_001823 [Porospora cf. gigantea A]
MKYADPHDEDYAFPFLPPLPFGVNRHWTLAQLEAHFGAADSTVYRRENLELVVAWKNVLGNFQAHVAIRLDERTR